MDAIARLGAGDLTDAELLCLYDLATSLRGDDDYGPQWQSVMDLCRASVLKRIAQATKLAPLKVNPWHVRFDIGDEDDDDEGGLSLRDHLRRAEASLDPKLPNVRLLNLYIYLQRFDVDQPVFNEVINIAEALMEERLERYEITPENQRHFPGYDPEQYHEAAKAVCSSQMPNPSLLTLCIVARNNSRSDGEPGQWWKAIHDMAYAQILARMRDG